MGEAGGKGRGYVCDPQKIDAKLQRRKILLKHNLIGLWTEENSGYLFTSFLKSKEF